jgi:hypothetical protein
MVLMMLYAVEMRRWIARPDAGQTAQSSKHLPHDFSERN